MKDININSPSTLCVIGNCYSLQKDHKMALKYFQRSTEINNFFTYGYTLCGHEHFSNDDIGKYI
jgi:anaphase-promoting complex subunit 3